MRPGLDMKAIASRLPMRNWNNSIEKITERGSGFQTTYEELKHDIGGKVVVQYGLPDYLWGIETKESPSSPPAKSGFQTTYEELKLWIVETIIEILIGFQTTYEELKHFPASNIWRAVQLPDYLWGIETPFRKRRW